jgi:hypothetical protein
MVVVNAGIGGNQVLGPEPAADPWRGGPAAIERLERDVLALSGVRTVFWLQGINDFSDNGQATAASVTEAMARAVLHMRKDALAHLSHRHHPPGLAATGGRSKPSSSDSAPARGWLERMENSTSAAPSPRTIIGILPTGSYSLTRRPISAGRPLKPDGGGAEAHRRPQCNPASRR